MSQMKSVAVRLPDSAIGELKTISEAQYIPLRTMIRAWLMQRINVEMGRTNLVEVEPEADEIEAICEGEKQFAAGEYVRLDALESGK